MTPRPTGNRRGSLAMAVAPRPTPLRWVMRLALRLTATAAVCVAATWWGAAVATRQDAAVERARAGGAPPRGRGELWLRCPESGTWYNSGSGTWYSYGDARAPGGEHEVEAGVP